MGFKGRICGLSANEMEDAFLTAGANAFMIKPFPCEKEPLKKELCRVIYRSGKAINNTSASNASTLGNPESAP